MLSAGMKSRKFLRKRATKKSSQIDYTRLCGQITADWTSQDRGDTWQLTGIQTTDNINIPAAHVTRLNKQGWYPSNNGSRELALSLEGSTIKECDSLTILPIMDPATTSLMSRPRFEHELHTLCPMVFKVPGDHPVIKPSSMTWYSLGSRGTKVPGIWQGNTHRGQNSIHWHRSKDVKKDDLDGSDDSDGSENPGESDDSSELSDSNDPSDTSDSDEGSEEDEADEALGFLYHDISIKAKDPLWDGDAWVREGINPVIVGGKTVDLKGLKFDMVHEEQSGSYRWRKTFVASGYKQYPPKAPVEVSPADLEAGTAFSSDPHLGAAGFRFDKRPSEFSRFFGY